MKDREGGTRIRHLENYTRYALCITKQTIVLTALSLTIISRSVQELLEACGIVTARFKYLTLCPSSEADGFRSLKIFAHFVETGIPLLCTENPATDTYPEPDLSSHVRNISLKSILVLSLPV